MSQPILLASISALLIALPCSADPPRFVTEKEFSCKDIADAVNHYVRFGKADAIKEMKAEIARHGRESRVPMRICFVCRILFEPKAKQPLWPPGFGGLFLPYESMPSEKWPHYPLVQSGSSYFLLNEDYEIGGRPEPEAAYLAYCQKNGKFRRQPVAVPMRKQALADLEKLQHSDAWKTIRWEGYDEAGTLRYLKAQAERTPAK